MYRHLVTVEVGVKGRAHQGVQLDGLAFNQNRLKCLNTQAVQGGRTVEQNRMFANHVFQDIPHLGHFLLHQFFGGFDGRGQAQHFQLVENKRFEQLQRHFFRQAALMQTQVRAHGNHRTAGVIHAFTQ